MIEAVISLPVFLVIIFFLIDVARYFLFVVVLNYAAQSAVDYASKIEVETDTYSALAPASACQSAACRCTPIECQRYHNRVQAILDHAMNKALLIARTSDSGNSTRLINFTLYDSSDYSSFSGLNNAILSDVVFLRPGERAIYTGSNPVKYMEHSTRPFTLGWPKIMNNENWGMVMQREPLEVRFNLQFDWITPFLPHSIIDIRAHAFRATKAFGVGAPPPILPTSTPTTTPTRTPTRTSTITPTASISPTPSQTPTASLTPQYMTPTTTPTITTTSTPSATPTPSRTSTITATPTQSQTPTQTATSTITMTPINTPTATSAPNCDVCSNPALACTVSNKPLCDLTGYCHMVDCGGPGK